MTDTLCLLSATELLKHYEAKTLSPVQVVEACLHRIDELNPVLNAFCLVDYEGARQEAKLSEERWQRGQPKGLLDGVPATVKDLLLWIGKPTLRGSLALSPEQLSTEDSPCVARLKEAGAILLGKTTTPEIGHKGVTHSPRCGISRNPFDPAMTCGGSSGGAAIAAATGMAPLNLGTDGGGSVRIPAAFSGIVGHKPQFGIVPFAPPSPYGTLSHVGPMCRTVEDAALMLRVIARSDTRDWFAPHAKDVDFLAKINDGVKGLRVAFAPTINNAAVNPEIAVLVAQGVDKLRELGAIVTPITLDLARVEEIFQEHWTVGCATALEYNYTAEQQKVMDRTLRKSAAIGAKTPLLQYTKAVVDRAKLGAQMRQLYENFDLLVTPTMPIAAFEAGLEQPGPETERGWVDFTPFTYPFNLTGQPAITVPCGLVGSGLPAGLQIIGDLFQDQLVFTAAHALQKNIPSVLPQCALTGTIKSTNNKSEFSSQVI